MEKIGLALIGPKRLASQLEGSKVFTRELLDRHLINGNPEFKVCRSQADINIAINQLKVYNLS